jgi:hypothetical protein
MRPLHFSVGAQNSACARHSRAVVIKVDAAAKSDGSDDPERRQKNRRVEAVVNTCK